MSKSSTFTLPKLIYVAFTFGYLTLISQFVSSSSENDRYFLFWNFRFVFSLIIAWFLISLIYCIPVVIAFRGKGGISKFVKNGVVMGGSAIVIYALLTVARPWILEGFHIDKYPPLLKIFLLLIAPVYFGFIRTNHGIFFLKKILKVATLLPLITIIFLFFYTSYDVHEKKIEDMKVPLNVKERQYPNIYIFMFDGWDYNYVFENNKIRRGLENLTSLRNDFDFFHNATSPTTDTRSSVTRYIFGMYDTDILTKSQAKNHNSIFDKPEEMGYFTTAIGFYLNYFDLLNSKIDYAFTLNSQYDQRMPFWRIVLFHYEELACYFNNLLKIDIGLDPLCYKTKYKAKVHYVTHDKILKIIQEIDLPTVGFFHYRIPRDPYIFSNKGVKIKNFKPDKFSVLHYEEELGYVDQVMGEIILTLKKAKKYENSFIIFTSDHGRFLRQKENPTQFDRASGRTRPVPFLLKKPNQRSGKDRLEPYKVDIYNLLNESILPSVRNSLNKEYAEVDVFQSTKNIN